MIINESIFKNDVPEAFTKYAIEFYKKLSKKVPFKEKKGLSPVEFIEKYPKNSYFFDINDDKLDRGKGLAKAAVKGAVLGAIAGPALSALPDQSDEKLEKQAKEKLDKIISTTDLKLCTNKDPAHKGYYIKFMKKDGILVRSWSGCAVSGGYYTTCGIGLCYEKLTEKTKWTLESANNNDIDIDGVENWNAKQREYEAEQRGHQDDETIVSAIEENNYIDPIYSRIITEYFDISNRHTRRTLLSMNEAQQNSVLMSLTSKLYDKIVSKCDDIDYGEIPSTKGDITKLSKYNDMKDTIAIMHDLLKEYKQDTGPVDELAVAFSNVETRKDLFTRAYRYNVELPIAMYCNVVLGIITGISYMIATCIEFIKNPGEESFSIALDKLSYAKTKDHMIYSSLKSFNKSCANHDFDKAMEAVLKSSTKNFGGAAATGGLAIAIIVIILGIIPVLRELIFLFYYTRMRISDFFDIQAELLQMNAYAIESNSTLDKDRQKEVMAKQLKIVEKFKKVSNTFAIDMKKTESEVDKEKRNDNETQMLIDDIDGIEGTPGTSALF